MALHDRHTPTLASAKQIENEPRYAIRFAKTQAEALGTVPSLLRVGHVPQTQCGIESTEEKGPGLLFVAEGRALKNPKGNEGVGVEEAVA
jgi:hypothetical protein